MLWIRRNVRKSLWKTCILILLLLFTLSIVYFIIQCPHQSELVILADTTSDADRIGIYIITPTYARPVQKAELTRLIHTFIHVKHLHWILVEDAEAKTVLVTNILRKSGLKFTHLNIPTPPEKKLQTTDKKWIKPRGVLQRNEGLKWLRSYSPENGVMYFADDDNTYDLELFDEIRSVKSVGVWPVAFVGELMVEKPVIENGHVTSWDVAYKPERPFALDMAGFAVNIRLLKEFPEARFDFVQPVGYQETHFLRGLNIQLHDLEPKAAQCTKVLVWHTRTEKINLIQERRWNQLGRSSYDNMEV